MGSIIGYLSNNSFRFFEAARYGTIIITSKLYKYWFYKNFPGIQVKSWGSIHKHINQILDDPEMLQQLHKETLDYYQSAYSEEVVASYIKQIISQLDPK